jgi:hypothetical protein
MRWIAIIGVLATATTQARAAPCVKTATHPTQLTIAGGAVEFCLGQREQLACYAVALDSGALTTRPAASGEIRRLKSSAPLPRIEEEDESVSICRPDGSSCRRLTPQDEFDPGLGITTAVNEAGTLAALGYLARRLQVEVFDLVSGKRLGKVSAGSKKLKCIDLSFVGDALYVGEADCGGETVRGWLATKTGKRVATLGGSASFKPSGDAVHVNKNLWAFSSAAGDRIVIQDVKTGKVTKRISIGAAEGDARAALLGDGKHLVLVFDGSRAGDVALIEVATGKVTTHSAPRCT